MLYVTYTYFYAFRNYKNALKKNVGTRRGRLQRSHRKKPGSRGNLKSRRQQWSLNMLTARGVEKVLQEAKETIDSQEKQQLC